MSFLNFLKQELPNDWIITEEVNVNWDGIHTTAIYKSLLGTRYKAAISTPIQLIVLTSKPLDAKMVLDDFVARNHTKYYIDGFSTYIKQSYLSPIVPVVATPTGNTLTNQVILSGTLLISDGVMDVTEIFIDGQKVDITDSTLAMSTDAESQVKVFDVNNQHAITQVKKGVLTFEFSLVNKNNSFCNKLKSMRMSNLSLDWIFNVELRFTNLTNEQYRMRVTSQALSPSDGTLPVLKVTMAEAGV